MCMLCQVANLKKREFDSAHTLITDIDVGVVVVVLVFTLYPLIVDVLDARIIGVVVSDCRYYYWCC